MWEIEYRNWRRKYRSRVGNVLKIDKKWDEEKKKGQCEMQLGEWKIMNETRKRNWMIFEEELRNENKSTYAKKKYPENRNIRQIMKNRERRKKRKKKKSGWRIKGTKINKEREMEVKKEKIIDGKAREKHRKKEILES